MIRPGPHHHLLGQVQTSVRPDRGLLHGQGHGGHPRGDAAELCARNITANGLAPGWTITEQSAEFLGDTENEQQIVAITTLQRLGQPDDIAAVAAFLASDDGRWVTGQHLEASGGFDVAASR